MQLNGSIYRRVNYIVRYSQGAHTSLLVCLRHMRLGLSSACSQRDTRSICDVVWMRRWAKVGAQLPGRTDNSCWRRSKTLAAKERGTHKQPTAPRGSGGRFLRPAAPADGAAPAGHTPRETGSGADASEAAHVAAGETAAEPGSGNAERSGGQCERNEEEEEHAGGAVDKGAAAELAGGGKGRGKGRSGGGGKKGVRDTTKNAKGKVALGLGESAIAQQDDDGEGTGVADPEDHPPRKKHRARARR